MGARAAAGARAADAADGFWLAPVDEQSHWLTAFNSVMGRFEWLCTPMGLQPASGAAP